MNVSGKITGLLLAVVLVIAFGVVGCSPVAVQEQTEQVDMVSSEPTTVTPVPVQTPTEEVEMVTSEPTVVLPVSAVEIRGVDISSLPRVEDKGGVFYDEAGQAQDIFQILADHGVNYVRLKLWHTPVNGYNNLEKVKGMAMRIQQARMGFLLDFHYSDTWADPGKQYKPLAWWDFDYDQLEAAVYSYTKDAITALRE
ncbi:MAG: glycosyl hydrolase 53 family protein, partial [Anaerolineae bacterium]